MIRRMKIGTTVAAGLLVVLAACGSQDEKTTRGNGANAVINAAPGNAPSANATKPVPAPTEDVEIEMDDPALDFAYSWPARAAAIPRLEAWLRSNAKSLREQALSVGREDAKSAKEGGFPFHQHSYEESWAVVADVPRILVLQSEGYVFTGGAHGMPVSTVILWDKVAEGRRAIADIIDVKAMAAAATPAYCKALAVERTKKRGGDPAPIVDKDDPFNGCPALERQMLLPVSSVPGSPLDRLRVYIGPYEAGPYAEGVYEMDLPLNGAMLRAVNAEWRDAFGR